MHEIKMPETPIQDKTQQLCTDLLLISNALLTSDNDVQSAIDFFSIDLLELRGSCPALYDSLRKRIDEFQESYQDDERVIQVAAMQGIVARLFSESDHESVKAFDKIQSCLSSLSGNKLKSAFALLQIEFVAAGAFLEGGDLTTLREKAKTAFNDTDSAQVTEAVRDVFSQLQGFMPYHQPDFND